MDDSGVKVVDPDSWWKNDFEGENNFIGMLLKRCADEQMKWGLAKMTLKEKIKRNVKN